MIAYASSIRPFRCRGNPDKCDHLGNTALHCAAARGHSSCVTFLVNFGVNIWALDNDFHTALEVAAMNENMNSVHFLDAVVAKQSALNKKLVRKLKERSILDAQKRVKEFNKRQAKSQKKAKLEDKRMTEMREKLETTSLKNNNTMPRAGYFSDSGDQESKWNRGSIHSEHARPYSDHFSTSRRNHAPTTAIMRKINHKKRAENGVADDFRVSEIQDGHKSVRSLSGLRRDSQVLYVGDANTKTKPFSTQMADRKSSSSEPDFTYSNGDSGVLSYDDSPLPQESASLFDRPGLGSIAFLRSPLMGSGAMMSLPAQDDVDQAKLHAKTNGTLNTNLLRQHSYSDSIGTLGSLARRVKELPWNEDELESLDNEGDLNKNSPLELFLASCGLTEFISVLCKEKIDLDALLLCSDDDLRDIGIPLGPRRKMLDAARKRKEVLNAPGVVMDTHL